MSFNTSLLFVRGTHLPGRRPVRDHGQTLGIAVLVPMGRERPALSPQILVGVELPAQSQELLGDLRVGPELLRVRTHRTAIVDSGERLAIDLVIHDAFQDCRNPARVNR